jgi:hypothetical protein
MKQGDLLRWTVSPFVKYLIRAFYPRTFLVTRSARSQQIVWMVHRTQVLRSLLVMRLLPEFKGDCASWRGFTLTPDTP